VLLRAEAAKQREPGRLQAPLQARKPKMNLRLPESAREPDRAEAVAALAKTTPVARWPRTKKRPTQALRAELALAPEKKVEKVRKLLAERSARARVAGPRSRRQKQISLRAATLVQPTRGRAERKR
jgi:hypothetical protein